MNNGERGIEILFNDESDTTSVAITNISITEMKQAFLSLTMALDSNLDIEELMANTKEMIKLMKEMNDGNKKPN